MIKFNFNNFLTDKRLNQKELADLIGKPEGTVSIMIKRGTAKPSVIRTIETKYGDCTKYILKAA